MNKISCSLQSALRNKCTHSRQKNVNRANTLLSILLLAIWSVLGSARADDKAGGFVIGVSNAFINPHRVEQIADIQATAKEYQSKEAIKDLIIASSNTDVQGQIAQIRNLMNKGVDGIVINAASPTALNAVLKEAMDGGIKVIGWDNELALPGTYSVVYDQEDWATETAEWLVKSLNGKGNVVIVNGVAGAPLSGGCYAAVENLFYRDPGIKGPKSVYCDLDGGKEQQEMAGGLALPHKIYGVL